MKIKSYLLAGLGIMMLASCGNDEVIGNGDDNKLPIEGEGYMTLSLKFAGNDPASRADGDIVYENGEGAESKINNAYIYFFSQDTGNNFLGVTEVTAFNLGEVDASDNNVETKIEAYVPDNVVQTLAAGEKANIIVVLNRPAKFPEMTTDDSNPSTYTTFNQAVEMTDDAGFMMTSVNYYDVAKDDMTTTSIPTFFTEVTKDNIAKKGDPVTKEVTVYVERVCGKVLLKTKEDFEKSEKTIVKVIKWGLNVRKKSVYPVKVLTTPFSSEANDDGILDSHLKQAWWNNKDRHRSFWAKDPNYDGEGYIANPREKDYPFKLTKISSNNQNDDVLNGTLGNPLYCLENTFNNARQTMNETTTAVVLAQYTPADIDENATWMLYNNTAYSVDDYINNFFRNAKIYTDAGYLSLATNTSVEFKCGVTKVNEIDENQIGGEGFSLALTSGTTLYAENSEKAMTQDELNALFASYAALTSFYVNSYCYYEIPIRHFSEVEWTEGEAPNQVGHLGRYGIVRNNYYKLTINSIKNPGKPIVNPTDPILPPIDPDDKLEYYMDVTINVLKWAVRTQGVDL